MAGQQQQQQQGGGDNSLAVLWILVGLFITCGIIWYQFHAAIVGLFLKIKLFEINIVSLYTDALSQTKAIILNTPPAQYGDVPAGTLADLATTIGNYLRYPLAIILVMFAGIIYVSHAVMRYRKIYSMEQLVHQEYSSWPQIMPVVKLDLVNEPITKGPWAMAETPMEFAKKHSLLKLEKTVSNEPQALPRPKTVATVLRGEAHRVFTLQCGRYWTGLDSLAPHMQTLLAIFAARAVGDREGSTRLLEQIDHSSLSGRLDFSGTRELLRKHINDKRVVKILRSHAFVYSMMASMFELARRDGVLASAEFLWLKPLDRSFWYMMNCVGRLSPFVEVAGPFAHWIAEKKFGRPIFVPMVDQAVSALDVAIQEVLYKEEEGG